MAETMSLENPVMSAFAFYSILCLLKMFALVFYTAKTRFKNNVFANQEDILGNPQKHKPILNDADVERIRRNHLNDLENIPAFLFVGFLYVLTGPSVSSALLHFRVFTAARFAHTAAYQLPLPQPARALTFMVGMVTTISMAIQVLMATAG